MNVFDCITKRRSTRSFSKKSVDDKLIGLMLHMATHAPSSGNMQEWEFVIVKDEKQKKKLSSVALRQDFVHKAPVVIVVCADLGKANLRYEKRGESLYAIQDTANATMLILLSAHALGLSTCWVGAFDEDAVKMALELPENLRPLAIVPVGYSLETPKMPERMPFDNLTSVNKHGKRYDISYFTQPPPTGKVEIKPIGNIIEDFLKKAKKKESKD